MNKEPNVYRDIKINELDKRIEMFESKIKTLNLYIDVLNNKVNDIHNTIVYNNVNDNNVDINKLVDDVYNACNYGNYINKNDLKELINKHITLSDERNE